MKLTEQDVPPHRLGYGDVTSVHIRFLCKDDAIWFPDTLFTTKMIKGIYKVLYNPYLGRSGWIVHVVKIK